MVRVVAIAACVLAGCYSARAFPGAPCASDGECPSGLTCIADQCDLPGSGSPADGPSRESDSGDVDVTADAQGPPGPNGWYAPTAVPGVNTSATETDPSFTDDDLTIVFTSDRAGGTGGLDLYIGTRASVTEPFTVRELTELNSTATDQSPEISTDGLTIYFSTTRGGANALIYSATRASTTAVFGAPAEVAGLSKNMSGNVQNSIQIGVGSPLTAMVIQVKSTAMNEADGFGRNAITDSWADQEDLMTAGGTPLPTDITAPSLTPDNTIIYFQSGTPAQIYMTTYTDASDAFTTPVAITELNTGTHNAAPEINAGASHIVFERDGDLFEATK
jgi:hypothetical protein